MEIELYTPHSGQKQMHESKARFRIACCGRRFGKTYMGLNEIVKYANENEFSTTTWVSPTFRQARVVFNIIVRHFERAFLSCAKNTLEIKWLNGSLTKFLSTEAKDRLRGDSSDLMVIDEAASIDEEIWTHILRPMLSDTQGKAIIISTPKSFNWFHTLFQRGDDPMYPQYASFTFPTSANPYIKAEEIEEVRTSLPYDVFRQEYLAEFLEGRGTVFKNIRGCIAGTLEEPIEGKQYTCGFDVAKHSDFSCIVVLDNDTNQVVYFDRFNRIDYIVQVKRMADVAHNYNNARVIMDSTGVGDPILESLKAAKINAEGFQFTNKSKQQLIEHLAVQLERKEVTYPEISVLLNELGAYQYELSRAGNLIYNAGSGHDDSVIALALAVWGVKHGINPRILLL